MKKFLLVLAFIVFGFSAFAQRNILDINGNDWIKLNTGDKTMMMAGWLSAMSAISIMGFDLKEYEATTEEEIYFAEFLMNWGSYGLTANDLVAMVNYAYSLNYSLDEKLWQVILMENDKSWW